MRTKFIISILLVLFVSVSMASESSATKKTEAIVTQISCGEWSDWHSVDYGAPDSPMMTYNWRTRTCQEYQWDFTVFPPRVIVIRTYPDTQSYIEYA